ncbi:TetR/AcrR family transcriptional regulator [Leptolyngbya sp. CCNP1308]|uniref:TetR/AcrR family transcriptional regulator n=1 Tax=Leptolyngbya sp. CCNP1308 TaxID=3110255 RepID=UPI002B1EC5AD|nr:TetR/AcrR family transcriptional regulator [Leptolyngbya sp. CCNP1308]MEA5449988.1 TetR/AcrR family transcriptional regulator [Leptolyngbya sp. CCNP1308]
MGRKPGSSTANNRSLIVSAAYKLLAEEGYDAATMKEIAQGAGVAPGLIHYYFNSKDQLLQEVLYTAGERYVKEVEHWCNTLTAQQLLETTFTEPKRRVANEPEWFRLRCELFALGLRNANFHEAVQIMLATGRQCIARLVRQIAGDAIANPEATAAVLLAAFDGLALQKLADPAFDLDSAYGVLMQMFMTQLDKS